MKKVKFTLIGKTLLLVLSLVFLSLASQAQAPSSTITGPLKAFISGADISLTSEVLTDNPNPTLTYTFERNTSGASIISQGPFIYNRNTGVGQQTIVLKPGTTKGSFNIKLIATTTGGTCESSKSVTVTNGRGSFDNGGNNAGQ